MPQDRRNMRKLVADRRLQGDGGGANEDCAGRAPSAPTWARRTGVLMLSGMAGLLTLGPHPEVLIKAIGAVLALMIGRAGQRALLKQNPDYVEMPISKRGYAVLATTAAAFSWPIWVLCNKTLVSASLVPALVCVWLAVYLFRGT
jgi:hypothetical protein